MPRNANPARRALITVVIIVAALAVVAMISLPTILGGGSSGAPQQAQPSASAPAQEAPGEVASADVAREVEPTADPAEPVDGPTMGGGQESTAPASADAAPPEPAGPAPVLRVRSQGPWDSATFTPIGGISDPPSAASDETMLLTFTPYGAGVESITLARYVVEPNSTEHYKIQTRTVMPAGAGVGVEVAPLATVGIEVSVAGARPVFVELRVGGGESLWRETAPGAFEAVVETADGEPALRIEKRYVLSPGSYDFRVEQRVVNLLASPVTIRFYQYGPADLPAEQTGYGIDVRRVRFGLLRPPQMDPSRQIVLAEQNLTGRKKILDRIGDGRDLIWPDANTFQPGEELVWLATTNRYFAFIVHGRVPEPVPPTFDKGLEAAERVHAVGLGGASDSATLILQLTSPSLEIAPGGAADVGVGAYAGPMRRETLAGSPAGAALELGRIIVYNLGGMCAACTFQPLAIGLLWFLRTMHSLLHDWSLSIVVLVFAVRAVLHPVTRRSQISLARFSKQMQGLAPKQQALREKYKDDHQKLQAEMARLMKEEGVSFTGALGCLPMFLQSPVWIALYAMLFFAFELRHEPAFYGVFQAVTGGRWSFMADMSAPDHFIDFGRTLVTLPLLGPITGVNILPLLLGVVFFLQQKYLTPPPSAAMTPEQESQQKIMRIITVVMFPLFMYNAPCGLTIYFITNSTLGIIESRWIRSHIDTLDLTAKKPSPGVKRVRNEASSGRAAFGRRPEAGPKKYKRRGE